MFYASGGFPFGFRIGPKKNQGGGVRSLSVAAPQTKSRSNVTIAQTLAAQKYRLIVGFPFSVRRKPQPTPSS
jgi:hypothetical protein